MITQRFFNLDNQWCVVHIPNKPNGFGVLVLGDRDHFVEGSTSLWIQHRGRWNLLQLLLDHGYTIFYAHLYGRNWGSSKAYRLAKQLYHLVMKQETLNKRVHILAEGMGALLALQLMEKEPHLFRSTAFLNPCIDFQAHIEHEKNYKFFYKQLMKEIKSAYEINEKQVDQVIANSLKVQDLTATVPASIWATTNDAHHFPLFHSKLYEEQRKKINSPIRLSLHIAEKKYLFHHSLLHFYRKNELVL